MTATTAKAIFIGGSGAGLMPSGKNNIRGSVYKYAPFTRFSHGSAIFQQDSFPGNTVHGQKMIKCGIQRDAWGSV